MAWTAPRTWVAGEVPTASIMNAHLRDNELVLSTHIHNAEDAGDGVRLRYARWFLQMGI